MLDSLFYSFVSIEAQLKCGKFVCNNFSTADENKNKKITRKKGREEKKNLQQRKMSKCFLSILSSLIKNFFLSFLRRLSRIVMAVDIHHELREKEPLTVYLRMFVSRVIFSLNLLNRNPIL